jgi:hypothetical protein
MKSAIYKTGLLAFSEGPLFRSEIKLPGLDIRARASARHIAEAVQ